MKVNLAVNADFSAEGLITPKSFTWPDGRKFQIETFYKREFPEPADLMIVGIKYLCRACGKDIALFCAGSQWYINLPDKKVVANSCK